MKDLINNLESYVDFAKADGMLEEADMINETVRRLNCEHDFVENVACLFCEGVEFMDKAELYNSFKSEFYKYMKERSKYDE